MTKIDQLLQSAVLKVVADDYESIDTIEMDLAAGIRVPGVLVEQSKIISALRNLIHQGLVNSYIYDSALQKFIFSESAEETIYYYVTDKGKAKIQSAGSEIDQFSFD